MMSGGENGSQEGGSTGPSVHERIQDGGSTTGAECWLLGSQPKARNARVELMAAAKVDTEILKKAAAYFAKESK
jgi:hypothetical protein